MLGKSYEKGTCSLSDLNVHNGIEHDASITRACRLLQNTWCTDKHLAGDDSVHQPDQGKPNATIIEPLLKSVTGKDAEGKPQLTIEDLSFFMAKRRADAKAANPNYSLSLFHRAFSFTKFVHMLSRLHRL